MPRLPECDDKKTDAQSRIRLRRVVSHAAQSPIFDHSIAPFTLIPRYDLKTPCHHFAGHFERLWGGQVGGQRTAASKKRLYFTEILLGENSRLDFDAHFLWALSALINSETNPLSNSRNQVRENTDNYGVSGTKPVFEMRRFSYAITDDGKKPAVGWIRQNYAGEARRRDGKAGQTRGGDAGNLGLYGLSFRPAKIPLDSFAQAQKAPFRTQTSAK